MPTWLQAAPLTLTFLLFFAVPLVITLIVSFWNFNEYRIIPAFTLKNYAAIFKGCGSLADVCVTFKTYWSTLRFCVIVWAVTLLLGFGIAYFPGVSRAFAWHADRAMARLAFAPAHRFVITKRA